MRLAISLHSADPATRREIMPSSYEGFLERLAAWSNRYLTEKGGRRRLTPRAHEPGRSNRWPGQGGE